MPAYKNIRSASEQGALAFAQLFRLEKKKLLFVALQSLGGDSDGSLAGSSPAAPVRVESRAAVSSAAP